MSEVGKGKPPKEHQFKPGQSGNPAGGKPGVRHLSTLIQDLYDNIDWDKTNLKSKTELSQMYGKQGLKALVYVAFSKGMSGDTKAMEWLAKHGYGEKLNVELTDDRKEILAKYGLTDDRETTKT